MDSQNYSSSINIKIGNEALVHFHNEALKYPESYTMSFEELKGKLSEQSHGMFLSGFGDAIVFGELTEGEVKEAMIGLADAGEGKLPAQWNSFFMALKKNYGFSWSAALGATTKTFEDLAAGAQKIGGTVTQTLSNASGLVTLLPYLAFAGIVAYIYFRVKK